MGSGQPRCVLRLEGVELGLERALRRLVIARGLREAAALDGPGRRALLQREVKTSEHGRASDTVVPDIHDPSNGA